MTSRSLMAITAGLGLAICLASAAWAQAAQTQPKSKFGRREYVLNCAGCHGPKGKGDGLYKPYLTKSPADLTVLAKANNGEFPTEKAYEIIDGRKDVADHGPRDMPIWGFDYKAKARGDHMEVPYEEEKYVQTRIAALIEYLREIQEK